MYRVLAKGDDDDTATMTDEEKRRARGDELDDDDIERKEEGEGEGDDDKADKGKPAAKEGKATDDDAEAARVVADDDDPMVPRARLNEVLGRFDTEREARLRLEGENAALKRGVTGTPGTAAEAVVDIDELQGKAFKALIEGDEEGAAKLQRQVNAAIKHQAKTEAKAEAVAEVTLAQDTRVGQRVAQEIVKDYPELDSNNAKLANQEAIDEFVLQRDSYRARGYSTEDAMRRAATVVASLYDLEPRTQKGEGDDKGKGKDDEGTKRTAGAARRGGEAANRQPPTASQSAGKGARARTEADVSEVGKMSDSEFSKLPAEEKRRLRGDYDV